MGIDPQLVEFTVTLRDPAPRLASLLFSQLNQVYIHIPKINISHKCKHKMAIENVTNKSLLSVTLKGSESLDYL